MHECVVLDGDHLARWEISKVADRDRVGARAVRTNGRRRRQYGHAQSMSLHFNLPSRMTCGTRQAQTEAANDCAAVTLRSGFTLFPSRLEPRTWVNGLRRLFMGSS